LLLSISDETTSHLTMLLKQQVIGCGGKLPPPGAPTYQPVMVCRAGAGVCLFIFCPGRPIACDAGGKRRGGRISGIQRDLAQQTPVRKYDLKIKRADDSYGGADLYIAVGMKAATQIASKDIPTLNVFVPKTGYDKILRQSASHATYRSAIYLDQPLERQIALLMSSLPETRHVGVLYSATRPNCRSCAGC